MVGSKIIDRTMGMMRKGELMRATVTWKQAHFSAVMSGLLQLPITDSKGSGEEATPFPGSNPTASREFCLDDVWGPVCTTQRITIPTFGTISIHGNTCIQGHCMWVHMLAEPAQGPQLADSMVLTATYGELHPCSSQVPISLGNLSAHSIEVPARAIIGKVTLANQVLLAVLQTEILGKSIYSPQTG